MPKRNDGNEEDLRIRPGAHSLDSDNPFTGAAPEGKDICEEGHGSQTDLPEDGADTPDGTLPYDWQDITDLCPSGFSPRLVDVFFQRILRNHFSDPDKIISELLKDLVYSDDPDESGIRIVMNTSFDTRQAGKTPSLVVKRGRQRVQRIAIDDLGERGDGLQGTPHYVRVVQGSHRILVVGSADGFTEELAFEVFTLLTCLSPNIRRDLPFLDFQLTDMSELGILEDLGNRLAVAIESVYAYEYGWTLKEVTPVMKRVLTQTSVELRQVTLE